MAERSDIFENNVIDNPFEGICYRCLAPLDSEELADRTTCAGERIWVCHLDRHRSCTQRLDKLKRDHQSEIARRIKKPGISYLIVVLDRFGAVFGYGNFYVEVPIGQSPDDVYARFLHQHGWKNDDELVIGEIIEVKNGPDSEP